MLKETQELLIALIIFALLVIVILISGCSNDTAVVDVKVSCDYDSDYHIQYDYVNNFNCTQGHNASTAWVRCIR